jgi:hypothetical protein
MIQQQQRDPLLHRRHYGLQVPMNYPNVLTIQFKGQMWNSIFHINYPTHVNILMFQLQ